MFYDEAIEAIRDAIYKIDLFRDEMVKDRMACGDINDIRRDATALHKRLLYRKDLSE